MRRRVQDEQLFHRTIMVLPLKEAGLGLLPLAGSTRHAQEASIESSDMVLDELLGTDRMNNAETQITARKV